MLLFAQQRHFGRDLAPFGVVVHLLGILAFVFNAPTEVLYLTVNTLQCGGSRLLTRLV
jgi:hypothetical protein